MADEDSPWAAGDDDSWGQPELLLLGRAVQRAVRRSAHRGKETSNCDHKPQALQGAWPGCSLAQLMAAGSQAIPEDKPVELEFIEMLIASERVGQLVDQIIQANSEHRMALKRCWALLDLCKATQPMLEVTASLAAV